MLSDEQRRRIADLRRRMDVCPAPERFLVDLCDALLLEPEPAPRPVTEGEAEVIHRSIIGSSEIIDDGEFVAPSAAEGAVDEAPTAEEAAAFVREQCAIRLRHRIEAAEEREGEGVAGIAISLMFARQLLRALDQAPTAAPAEGAPAAGLQEVAREVQAISAHMGPGWARRLNAVAAELDRLAAQPVTVTEEMRKRAAEAVHIHMRGCTTFLDPAKIAEAALQAALGGGR